MGSCASIPSAVGVIGALALGGVTAAAEVPDPYRKRSEYRHSVRDARRYHAQVANGNGNYFQYDFEPTKFGPDVDHLHHKPARNRLIHSDDDTKEMGTAKSQFGNHPKDNIFSNIEDHGEARDDMRPDENSRNGALRGDHTEKRRRESHRVSIYREDIPSSQSEAPSDSREGGHSSPPHGRKSWQNALSQRLSHVFQRTVKNMSPKSALFAVSKRDSWTDRLKDSSLAKRLSFLKNERAEQDVKGQAIKEVDKQYKKLPVVAKSFRRSLRDGSFFWPSRRKKSQQSEVLAN